jgi:hypothetical protein
MLAFGPIHRDLVVNQLYGAVTDRTRGRLARLLKGVRCIRRSNGMLYLA